ncbi:uncharacterized protein LOC144347838 [Saccoglossus kowalevskii]
MGLPGTPYMAPECLLHQSNGTTMSDMWSVGITLLKLYTGKDAWAFDDDSQISEGDNAGNSDAIAATKEPLYSMLQGGNKPSCLKLLSSHAYIHDMLAVNIDNCLDYDPKKRPTALLILQSII